MRGARRRHACGRETAWPRRTKAASTNGDLASLCGSLLYCHTHRPPLISFPNSIYHPIAFKTWPKVDIFECLLKPYRFETCLRQGISSATLRGRLRRPPLTAGEKWGSRLRRDRFRLRRNSAPFGSDTNILLYDLELPGLSSLYTGYY